MDIGFSKIDFDISVRMLDELPKKISDNAISGSAAAALRPARNYAARKVRGVAKGENGQSKARFVARYIKIKKLKKTPGAQIKVLGPDIPVYDRNWKLAGYAKLLAYGSYIEGKRKWRSNKNKNTGSVDGIGNFILEGVTKNRAAMEKSYEKGIIKEMERAKKKVGFI